MEKRKGIKQLEMSGLDASTIDNTTTVSMTKDKFFVKGSNEIDRRTISKVQINGQSYDIKIPSVDAEIKKIWNRLNMQVSLVHNCANCGAILEIEENKPIFHCKYCGSTYIIGPTQIYSHY